MNIRMMKIANRLYALGLSIMMAAMAGAVAADDSFTPADAQGRYRFMITFAEPGLLEQRQRTPGARFEVTAPATVTHRDRLKRQQTAHLQRIAGTIGRAPDVSHYFLVFESAVGARLTPEEAGQVRRLPGVVSVERERSYELATHRGPSFIGADTIWDGSAVPDGLGTRGEGMIGAVLDTGVAPAHPSFANDPACGHGVDGNPDKLISFLDCASTDGNGLCNGSSPTDNNSHGTHVASTMAGNTLDDSASPPPDPPAPFTSVSGVAPCAHIRSYKVCATDNCAALDIQAGMSSVLLHGDADVMNFSISGGYSPWSDNDRRKLDLVEAGVLVAAAAGNTRPAVPDPVGAVGHLGPWVLTVASSTHDGEATGLLSAAGPGEPPENTRDISAAKGSASPNAGSVSGLPIRHFTEQPDNFEGCTAGEDGVPGDLTPFPPGFFHGAAALIHRGTCPFPTKISNAFNAGAELVIIRNNQPTPISMDTTGQPDVPAYSINQAPGNALVAFVDTHPDEATVDFVAINGDVLAATSLRGPTPAPYQDLQKPDISAPGVDIYAAVPAGYGNKSGTSMASPHVAGAALLLRAVRPDWSVPEVKSALMMTAGKSGRKSNGFDFWDWDDVGSGRVDLSRAAKAGLVMDESTANYLAANPDTGGDVKTLNIAAVRNTDCAPECSFTRTLRSTLDDSTTWQVTIDQPPGFEVTVTPDGFVLEPGESQALTITAAPLSAEPGAALRFGAVNLHTVTPDQSPDLHLTAVLRGTGPEDRPIIAVDPDNFEFTLETGDTAAAPLHIDNPGSEPLTWSIGFPGGAGCEASLPAWLDVEPQSAMTPNGGATEVTLTVDSAGLPVDTHETTLCIASNDPLSPETHVPVRMTVTELVMAADLAASLTADKERVAVGETIVYTIEVSNAGPRDVSNARVISDLGSGWTQLQWSCDAPPGGQCPATGSGELNAFIDLVTGASVNFQVTATLATPADKGFLTSSAIAIAPDGLADPNPSDNLATIAVQTVHSGIFADRFENNE